MNENEMSMEEIFNGKNNTTEINGTVQNENNTTGQSKLNGEKEERKRNSRLGKSGPKRNIITQDTLCGNEENNADNNNSTIFLKEVTYANSCAKSQNGEIICDNSSSQANKFSSKCQKDAKSQLSKTQKDDTINEVNRQHRDILYKKPGTTQKEVKNAKSLAGNMVPNHIPGDGLSNKETRSGLETFINHRYQNNLSGISYGMANGINNDSHQDNGRQHYNANISSDIFSDEEKYQNHMNGHCIISHISDDAVNKHEDNSLNTNSKRTYSDDVVNKHEDTSLNTNSKRTYSDDVVNKHEDTSLNTNSKRTYSDDVVNKHEDNSLNTNSDETDEKYDELNTEGIHHHQYVSNGRVPARLEPIEIQKKKRKRKRYLKRLSSKVAVLPPIADDRDQNQDQHSLDGVKNIPKTCDKDTSGQKTPDKAFFYCRFITKYPILAFFLASTIHIITIVSTACLVAVGSNVFPIDFEKLPLVLFDDSTRKRDLAWRSRDSFGMRITRPVFGIYYPTWIQGQANDIVEVILEVESGDILSKDNMLMIERVENMIFNFKDYPSTYCQRDIFFQCIKPWSILRLFDGTYQDIDSKFRNPDFNNPRESLCTAMRYSKTKEFLEYFLQKGYNPCKEGSTSTMTRLFLMMGYPLSGGNSNSRIESFLVNQMKPHLEYIRDDILAGRMELFYTSQKLFNYDVQRQALKDMLLAIGSFLFIFLVMWIQTGSFTITFFGIFSILTSFLLANLIYRYAFKYEYFGFFHIIAMFIILGIGADDVFVFYDSWRLTGDNHYASLAHRLTDCYSKAAKTTFVTSVTTMAAFLVSGVSPFLPVASFGIFSGILVGVNYVCDLIYFPTAIILYSEKVRPKTAKFRSWVFRICCCCCTYVKCPLCFSADKMVVSNGGQRNFGSSFLCTPRRTAKEDASRLFPTIGDLKQTKMKSSLSNLQNEESKSTGSTTNIEEKVNTTEITSSKSTIRVKKEFEERIAIVRFLRHGFFSFITLRVVRVGLPVIFVGASAFFIYSATNLQPDSKQVQIYRDTHNYAKAQRHHYYSFQRNFEEEYTSVYLVWGLREKDTSVCSKKTSSFCSGKVVWDKNFNPSTPEAQTAIYNLCRRLENATDAEINLFKIRRSPETNKPEVDCFITAMETFVKEEVDRAGTWYPSDMKIDVPLDGGNMTKFMTSNYHIYEQPSTLSPDYNRWLEIGVGYWITNKYTGLATDDYFRFNSLFGEEYIPQESTLAKNAYLGLYYGTKMRYFGIRVNLTVSVYTLGYKEGKPIYDAWENLMEVEKKSMPASMQSGFQCTRNTWHWIRVQEVLSDSAVRGVIIGISITLPILILTTMNIIIGLLAWIVIALVATCVVGLIPLFGWKLGVLESLNLCMVVGLAVDYVVHLAESYRISTSITRYDKVRNMLEKMGLSVLSGAITTFGASIFLLFAQIQFLYEFGIFVMCTISISLLFSLLAFTSFMVTLGPEGHTGSLTALFSKCCCCNKKGLQFCKCKHFPSMKRFLPWCNSKETSEPS